MERVESITLACDDPDNLAAFWAATLDGERVDLPVATDDEKVGLPGDGPDLLFSVPQKGPFGTFRSTSI